MKMKIKVLAKRNYPELKKLEESFNVSEDGKVCVAVGGDGTFLQAARSFKGPILPIRGGEKNSLGFHADITLTDLDLAISELKSERYKIVKYPKLFVEYRGKEYEALNDVVLFRASPSSVHAKVFKKTGRLLELIYPRDVKGDGIIFAGYIGCTAYNYTAGGPLINREDDLVVTPICANPPSKTPVISKGKFCVQVTKNSASLDYDNARVGVLYEGDAFTVGLSRDKIEFIKLSKRESFAEKLDRLYQY